MNSVTASCASSSIVVAPTGSLGLMLSDIERAEWIGECWSLPQTSAFAELLIDCEGDRTLRAVLVGVLRESGRR